MISGLQRVREVLKWEGLGYALWRAGKKLLSPVCQWRISYLYQADLLQPIPEVRAQSGVEVKIYHGACSAETVKEQLYWTGAITHQTITERLRSGDVVAIACVEGLVAGFSWLAFSSLYVNEFDMVLHLGPDEAAQYNSYVAPEWRGRAIHRLLHAKTFELARERGRVRTFTWVQAINKASIKTQLRLGKQRVMTLVFARLRGTPWVWKTAFGTPLHERFRPNPVRKGQAFILSPSVCD